MRKNWLGAFAKSAVAITAVLLMSCASSTPQQATPPAAPGNNGASNCGPILAPEDLRKKPGYVEVGATVSDASGHDVTGITKDDFSVREYETKFPIEFFQANAHSGAAVGFLVDTSGSTQDKLPRIRTMLTDLIATLAPDDEAFLIAFSSRPFLLQPPTQQHELLASRASIFQASGQTALYDSAMEGIRLLNRQCSRDKVLVIITDGMDNTSRNSAKDVEQWAKTSEVKLVFIGVGDPNASKEPPIAVGPYVFGGATGLDVKTLDEMALQSGGSVFLVPSDADDQTLKDTAAKVALGAAAGLTLYHIGFFAPDPPGLSWQAVNIQVSKPPGATVTFNQPN